MPDYIQDELQPLTQRLRARYPGVRIVSASLTQTIDGVAQQNLRYQAPLAELKRTGLLTGEMLRLEKASRCETTLGEGFSLNNRLDCESRAGCWDLSIFTGATPRERERIGTTQAKRELRRIARAARKVASHG